jgi:hypothetical protein
MISDSSRWLSRSSTTLIAASAVALLAACGAGTGTDLGSDATSSQELGSSISATPAPTAPTIYTTVTPTTAGESAFQVVTQCDGGTVTLKAYPHGSGVGTTAVLRNPKDTQWRYSSSVTPVANPNEGVTMPEGTVHDGKLVVSSNNLTGPHAAPKSAKGLNRAWPQTVAVGLEGAENCGTLAYLDSTSGKFETGDLSGDISRSGAVSVINSPLAAAGTRRISVSVKSPDGDQHQAKTVQVKLITGMKKGSFDPYEATTTFQGLTSLQDFTSMTLTVTNDGHRTTWIKFSRTP